MNLQIWGTPAMCYDTIVRNAERIGAEVYIGVFSFAGMPWLDVERSMKCLVEEVMPCLQSKAITDNVAWVA